MDILNIKEENMCVNIMDVTSMDARNVFLTVLGYHAYTDHYQGRGHSSRPTAALINIHEPLI